MKIRLLWQYIRLNLNLPKRHESGIHGGDDVRENTHNRIFHETWAKKKRISTNMTIFESLAQSSQTDLLTKSIQFAKREIADNNLPAETDVIEVATDYVWQDGVTPIDYANIDIVSIPAWGGPMPIKIPR